MNDRVFWRPTHFVLCPEGGWEPVFLSEQSAYTLAEWEATDAADLTLDDDGRWLFQGQPFLGKVLAGKEDPDAD